MRDLHTHTLYSDGKNRAEEMVLAAIEKGLDEIGISDHAYTFFDESYCIKKENIPSYLAEIAALKEKYKDRITVKCGIEQDLYSAESTAPFDYAIGSLHYLKCGETYYPLDCKKEDFISLAEKEFGGDYYALAERYFSLVSAYAERDDITFIGHFDLITKYNEGNALFDENHLRFLAAAEQAADALLAAGKPFEINTGAIKRGYRTIPYPTTAIYDYLRRKGATFLLSSDAHTTDGIAFAFERYKEKM